MATRKTRSARPQKSEISRKGTKDLRSIGSCSPTKIGQSSLTVNINQNFDCTRLDESFLSLTHKTISVKANEWYNLETSRRLKKLDGRTFFVTPRVSGTIDLLIQFMMVNELELGSVVIPRELPDLAKQIGDRFASRKPKKLAVNDIDDIKEEDLNSIQPFEFSHFTAKAIVTRILDGDTVECALMLDPEVLSIPTTVRINNKATVGQRMIICSRARSEYKLLMKLKIRVFGVDAADCAPKSAPQTTRLLMEGKKNAATECTKNWCQASNNKIWLQLMGYDCRSRVMGRLYQRNGDRKSSHDLTYQLLHHKHPKYGKVAVAYEGGNKKEAWDC